MKSNELRKSSGSVRDPLPRHRTASRVMPINLRATRGPGLVRQFNRLLELLGYDQLSQRLRREAETAARRGDRGAGDFLADLRHEQELMA